MYGPNRFYRFLFLSYVTTSHEEAHVVHQGNLFGCFKKCVEDRDNRAEKVSRVTLALVTHYWRLCDAQVRIATSIIYLLAHFKYLKYQPPPFRLSHEVPRKLPIRLLSPALLGSYERTRAVP